jgi:transposase
MSSLIQVSELRKYHLYRKETDMRKGFDSLCGIIANELGKPVMNGDAFIFINKQRTHLKLLAWEKGGFTIFYRRLEKGSFEIPVFNLDAASMQLTAEQLICMLQGIVLASVKYRKRYQHQSTLSA